MKKWLVLLLFISVIHGCRKNNDSRNDACNMTKVHAQNVLKITISKGVWGTTSFTEGDCMPKIIDCYGGDHNTCKTCAVKRTVKIYEYTTTDQAHPKNTGAFYGSFDTKLIKEAITDDLGFFQVELPAGRYTLAIVENGKLYAALGDGHGGLNPFTVTDNVVNVNANINYRAAY